MSSALVAPSASGRPGPGTAPSSGPPGLAFSSASNRCPSPACRTSFSNSPETGSGFTGTARWLQETWVPSAVEGLPWLGRTISSPTQRQQGTEVM